MSSEEWSRSCLNHVASIEYGTRITRKNDGGSRYPVYGGGGATFLSDDFNREDCVIVSRFGMSEECVRKVEGRFFLNDSGLTATTHDENLLAQRFLDAFLLGSQPSIYSLGRGQAQRNLNVDAFRKMEVPLPPLDEQKRIVAVLDQAFAALNQAHANAEANRSDGLELTATAMLEMLAGLEASEHTLGDICEIYQPRTISTKELVPDGPYVVFGANGIIGRYDQYNHQDAEVLVTCRGATCGQVNVSEPYSWVTGNAMVVRPRSNALRKDFLELVLRNAVDWTRVITGAAQPQITRASLAPTRISIPALEVQDLAVEKFKTLRSHFSDLQNAATEKLADIATLRQSLLQAAFSGQLT